MYSGSKLIQLRKNNCKASSRIFPSMLSIAVVSTRELGIRRISSNFVAFVSSAKTINQASIFVSILKERRSTIYLRR